MEFAGFREDAFAFFRELSQNNSEEWFDAQQPRFEEFVLAPMRALVASLRDDLEKLHPGLIQEDIDAHFSDMRRGPQTRPGTPPIKTSFYCFFWDASVRRLNDGWFFVGVGADGVTIGMSIYDFGDPESRMRRVFKPRLRRYLTYLDDYIKANYLRRGFDFHRYVRAAGKLGIREVEAFPNSAAEWDATLGWVVKRHLHTESSRLTPGSFLNEVKESFERLYPLYSFTSDPREEFVRLLRVPLRVYAMQANGPSVPANPTGGDVVREATSASSIAATANPPAAEDSSKRKPAVKKARKKSAAKQAADGDGSVSSGAEKKKAVKKKTVKKVAKKKTAAKKKAAVKKKAAAKRKTAAKQKTAAKRTPARKAAVERAAAKPKKKKLAAKKKATAKRSAGKRSAGKSSGGKPSGVKKVARKKATAHKTATKKAVAKKKSATTKQAANRTAQKSGSAARKRGGTGARASARSR